MAGPYSPTDIRNYVGLDKQVSRGTAVAPVLFAAYTGTADVDHGVGANRVKESGALGQTTYVEKTGHTAGGTIPMLARPFTATKLIAYLMGLDTPGAAVSGVTPHVVTLDPDTDYVSVETNLADEAPERFRDSVIQEIVWTCDRDNPTLRMAVRWLAGAPLFQAAATAESYETEDPWLLSECAFTIDGGVTNFVQSFTLTERVLYASEKVGGGAESLIPSYHVKLAEETEIEVRSLLDDVDGAYRETLYGSAAGTTHATVVRAGTFVADYTRGAAATARQLKLNIPNVRWESAKYEALNTEETGNAVALVRSGTGIKVAGAEQFEFTGKTTDAAAYV